MSLSMTLGQTQAMNLTDLAVKQVEDAMDPELPDATAQEDPTHSGLEAQTQRSC